MADVSLTVQFANVLPVIIGGVLAIAGGLASQIAIHRLSDSRDRKKVRRERLESLVKALYAHEQWVTGKQNKLIFKNEDHDEPAPLNEIRMLQALHFPELSKEVLDVQEAFSPMLEFIHNQRIARMKDEKAFIANWNPSPFNEAYKNHLRAAKALTERCSH
ncbi:MAG: hypothetical protein IPH22_10450 [Nitrosomonas sp.]|nr:hypothetical protein [Nitrosomonas sp.]